MVFVGAAILAQTQDDRGKLLTGGFSLGEAADAAADTITLRCRLGTCGLGVDDDTKQEPEARCGGLRRPTMGMPTCVPT